MTTQLARYLTPMEDSSRWEGFEFRSGDIVINSPAKCGTTWTQTICALLIFQTPRLPAPLSSLSPWIDMLVRPKQEVWERLAAQRHRRFIKTHIPLDGIPADPRVTYITVGRDPRDVAISLRSHGRNLKREVIRRLIHQAAHSGDAAAQVPVDGHDERDLLDERTYLLRWVDNDDSPYVNLDSLRALIWTQERAWMRRAEPNVILLHYADLSADLEGQMRRLAARLGIEIDENRWPELVEAATFEQMRNRAGELAPDEQLGYIRDPERFFRSGKSGEWQQFLTAEDRAHYDRRIAELGEPDLLEWLHHGSR
ncbi:sulfotransferase domain-containing protein [Nonomuraea sp. MCN248]|uniref:Sulfotransferase domain-containing protein n=1 Tax=Nonomuraea corallina TaxID=2989783 RepID=A0ABT4SFD9_9ACTN|nr:sulfotransferase domain-containing protein [Nonomuraea corallina]MDA0635911.1 sulfotransferase domain-containing protein [Nonomuraea corallina]